jgi:gliding motility-associated transport system permease protein
MRTFLILLDREVKSFFYSPIGYVFMFFFLLLNGASFYIALSILNRGPSEVTVIEAFFNTIPFWIGFLLIFPLITMRTFAEEFKLGTVEPLMTAPVRDWQVVLSKFFGVVVFYVILWLPTVTYFEVFHLITKSAAVNAPGAYLGTYLLLLLMGMFYISVGCLASVLTSNQIIAAVISFVVITLLLFGGLLSFVVLHATPAFRDLIAYFSAIDHMFGFSKGIIDSRPVVYYLSMTALCLALTYQVFQSRKWKA